MDFNEYAYKKIALEQGLDERLVKIIVENMFVLVKKTIESGEMKTVHMRGLGKFVFKLKMRKFFERKFEAGLMYLKKDKNGLGKVKFTEKGIKEFRKNGKLVFPDGETPKYKRKKAAIERSLKEKENVRNGKQQD